MNLIQATRDQFHWLISIGRKIRKLTPLEAAGSITAFLFGQFFLVLAFFLPLKVILLLATEGVPWYLAGLVTIETKDIFILGIAIAAIASYGLYVLCEWLVGKYIRRGSQRIIDSSKKLHLFDNQADLARDGYLRLCRAVASGIMVLLGFALGFYLNSLLFGLLMGLVLLQFAALHYLLKAGTPLGQTVEELFITKQGVAFNFLSSSNFLIGFAVLFAQFLAAEQRNVIIAILTILLIRQIMSRLSIGIQDLIYLAKNRLRLTALFYTSIPYTPPEDKQQDAFLAGLAVPVRNEWLAPALAQVLERLVTEVTSKWVDSGIPGAAYLEVEAIFGTRQAEGADPPGASERYFVKCYHKSRAALAAHEVRLFSAMPKGIPCAPTYLGEATIGENHVLVFEGLPEKKPRRKQWKPRVIDAQISLWSTALDAELVRSYRRTHPTITSRMKPALFAHITPAVETEQEADIMAQFVESWPAIRDAVDQLPLVLKNPQLSPDFCRVDEKGALCLFSWSKWSIDTIGGAFLRSGIRPEDFEKVTVILQRASLPHPELAPSLLQLAAQLFALEDALKRKRIRTALDIIVEIIEPDGFELCCNHAPPQAATAPPAIAAS